MSAARITRAAVLDGVRPDCPHLRPERLVRLLLLALLPLSPACLWLPIPHTVVDHGHISGQVIDDATERPLPGVLVRVQHLGYEPAATTDDEGCFQIEEHESWRFLWIVPLLPVHPRRAHVILEFSYPGPVPGSDGKRLYRDLTIGLRAREPGSLVGDRGRENRGLIDDLGTIRLKTYEPTPRW